MGKAAAVAVAARHVDKKFGQIFFAQPLIYLFLRGDDALKPPAVSAQARTAFGGQLREREQGIAGAVEDSVLVFRRELLPRRVCLKAEVPSQ